MQFQYNADYPSGDATDPLEFPPADPNPCARITTRIFHPQKQQTSTVPNVLVKTLLPAQARRNSLFTGTVIGTGEIGMKDNSSSSSSSSSDDDDDVSMEELVDDEQEQKSLLEEEEEERAYWMQRTIREAIYGRVLFAVVLKKQQGVWQVTQEKCAIKEMSWQHIRRERDKLAEDPIKEVSAMQCIKNWWQQQNNGGKPTKENDNDKDVYAALRETNIMMPLDLLSDDRYLYSIMPYCDGGELFDRLDMNEKFSEEEARYWMHQVLNGLENLQHAGVCHRDMSLENLLVHQNGALVIDMGMCLRIPYSNDQSSLPTTNNNSSLAASMMSMTLEQPQNDNNINGNNNNIRISSGRTRSRNLISPQGTCGKWIYMSPEIYQNSTPFDGFAVDMWAAGVILFLMLTGFPPWEQAVATDERFRFMTAGYLVQMLTEWELGLSSDAMDLLQRMMWLDPKDRLSLDQVRAHPWMTSGGQSVQSQGTNDFM